MKKRVKSREASTPQQSGPDIVAFINTIQQQLALLDRKIDTLINRSSERPVEMKRFSMPPRFEQPQSQSQSHPQHKPEPRQDNGFRERVMHKAICADCSKPCEVPFKPSQDRPVYCKECYAKRRHGGQAKHQHDIKPKETPVAEAHHPVKHHAIEPRKTAEKKKPAARRRKK
jgi:CxxC-x17-CxxC domain-containing protein